MDLMARLNLASLILQGGDLRLAGREGDDSLKLGRPASLDCCKPSPPDSFHL